MRRTIVTESRVRKIPEGTHTITPHIVVGDAGRAAEWYAEALGAEERSRIPLPGGRLMSVELWFGDSAVMVADEFPEMGILSPQSVGGTSTVLNLYVEDVDALWERAVGAGPRYCTRSGIRSGETATGRSPTPSVTAGDSHSMCETSRPMRSPAPQQRRLALRRSRAAGCTGSFIAKLRRRALRSSGGPRDANA
jgi:uncharacterized glyoxalase superfamily protein PhnB